MDSEIIILIPPMSEVLCFNHLCKDENIVDGKIIRLKKWEYIKGITVKKEGVDVGFDYLSNDIMNFEYFEGVFGKQGAYSMTVENNHWKN